jgi:16S rRNA (uracil1498-N3)-methyltransferase
MHRFFVDPENITEGTALLDGSEYEHLTRVLRLKTGDTIEVFDGTGNSFKARVMSISDRVVKSEIIGENKTKTESDIKITLFQGLTKSNKMDYIVQKTTELGITRIVPIETTNTVVKNAVKHWENRQKRWQRIALEAAKQCGRCVIPKINDVILFEKALEQSSDNDLSIMPYEKERSSNLKSIIKSKTNQNSISVFIGPEGGFTPKEIKLAIEAGIKPVTLGPRILRTETAGIAVVSIIMYELGDMG